VSKHLDHIKYSTNYIDKKSDQALTQSIQAALTKALEVYHDQKDSVTMELLQKALHSESPEIRLIATKNMGAPKPKKEQAKGILENNIQSHPILNPMQSDSTNHGAFGWLMPVVKCKQDRTMPIDRVSFGFVPQELNITPISPLNTYRARSSPSVVSQPRPLPVSYRSKLPMTPAHAAKIQPRIGRSESTITRTPRRALPL
jgi:hypothetical protein